MIGFSHKVAKSLLTSKSSLKTQGINHLSGWYLNTTKEVT